MGKKKMDGCCWLNEKKVTRKGVENKRRRPCDVGIMLRFAFDPEEGTDMPEGLKSRVQKR